MGRDRLTSSRARGLCTVTVKFKLAAPAVPKWHCGSKGPAEPVEPAQLGHLPFRDHTRAVEMSHAVSISRGPLKGDWPDGGVSITAADTGATYPWELQQVTTGFQPSADAGYYSTGFR